MNESPKGCAPHECSHSPDNYQDEELDPRVQVELDRLNVATDEINKLESTLEDANNSFRNELSDNSTRLRDLGSKLGGAIEKARPYFEATAVAHRLQLDCQRSAVQYHRANAVHQAARSTISLAEERFTNPNHEHHREFDPAWQEMLNHATRKVLEAEAGRSASEREHEKRAASFNEAQKKVTQLGRQLKSSISKARPYFEQKDQFDSQMQHMSERVHSLQRAVAAAKANYSQALRNLERISEEIHLQRRFNSEKREPGVGAEEIIFDEPVCRAPSASEESKCDKSSYVGRIEEYPTNEGKGRALVEEEGRALVEGGDGGKARTVIGISAEEEQHQLNKRKNDKCDDGTYPNNGGDMDEEERGRDTEDSKIEANEKCSSIDTTKEDGSIDADKQLDGSIDTVRDGGIIDTYKKEDNIDTNVEEVIIDTVKDDYIIHTDKQDGSISTDKHYGSIDTVKDDTSIDTVKDDASIDTYNEDGSIDTVKDDARIDAVKEDCSIDTHNKDGGIDNSQNILNQGEEKQEN